MIMVDQGFIMGEHIMFDYGVLTKNMKVSKNGLKGKIPKSLWVSIFKLSIDLDDLSVPP